MVTLKHVYEIAMVKREDPPLQIRSLEDICLMICGTARSCGIKVVDKLNAEEYGEFLKQRKQFEEEVKKELQEKKDAKMLRTG